MRTRSPSSAPPENGEVGSTASTPTRVPWARRAVTSADVDVDLPTPGAPVTPTKWARPVCGVSAALTSRTSGERSSTSEISRATARASPAWARSTSSATGMARLTRDTASASALRHADDEGVALAAATTQAGGSDAASAAPELEREVQDDAGATRADRMTERDRTAVDVDLVLGDSERTGALDANRCECLVELEQIDVGDADALLGRRAVDRVGGLHLQARVGAGHGTGSADLGDPRQTELLGLGLAHHDHCRCTVGDLARRARGDRAVLVERRTQLGERLRRG